MMQNKNIPQGYKNSPLGIIPQEWEVKRLGDLSLSKGEYGINAPAVEYSENLPTYIRITDIDDYGNYNRKTKVSVDSDNYSTYILKDGDIVFARTGASVGKNYRYKQKDGILVFAGFLIRFSPNQSKLLTSFLEYSTQSAIYWHWVLKTSMRSGQPGINAEEYASYKIILPPLPEQQKIAEILTCWDEAIEKQSQLIEKLETRKRGIMQQLLTGKKRLKGFEGEWKRIKLGEILNESSILSPKTDVNKRLTVRLNLKGVEVRDVRGTEAEESTVFFIRKSGQFIYGKQNLHKGAFGIIPKDLNGYESTQDLPAFDFKDVVIASYFIYFISRKKIYEAFESIATGTGSKRIHPKDLFRLSFSFPSLSEQTAIANILSSADKEIEKEKAKLAALRSQKKGLMQVLLTGKKRVKINN